MMIRTFLFVALAVGVGTVSLAQSRSLVLTPAVASDLRADALIDAPDMPLANTSRDVVSFTWPAGHVPDAAPAPFQADSRSYGMTVSAARLARGVPLMLDAPGAIIRVSGQRAGQVINADRLDVVLASGREMTARAATDQLVSNDDLAAAGLNVAGQGIGIRLAKELGAGRVTLRYPMTQRDDRVRIDVFDRNSDKVLALQSAADQFMSATGASARVAWSANARGDALAGFALSPDGRRHALRFDAAGRASLAAPTKVPYQTGLWEWHVQATTTDGIRRDAKTVFALTPAVARFDNSVLVDTRPDGLHIALGTQVQSAGRYEARATLMATNADGKLEAALTSATAAWLEAGSATLSLHFDAEALKAQGLRAPFALHGLSLLDQSRMGTLERRRNALTF